MDQDNWQEAMNDGSINTCCPACDTTFNVTPGQLKVADGLVRCGSCLNVFNATLFESKPLSTIKGPTRRPLDQKPSGNFSEKASPTPPEPLQKPAQQQHFTTRLALPENNTGEFENTATARPFTGLITYVLIIGLMLLCVAQIFWFQKDQWVQKDQFRPVYQALFAIINLPLPARKAPELIINKQFVIQPHDEFTDAIRVSILLENTADFSQPFPALQLLFSDLKGRITAQRTLPSNEYINTGIFPQQLMPSKQPIQIQLDMMSPGSRAVGYQLNLISD